MANKNVSKVILGGTKDMGLGTKTVAEGITFQVNIVPVTKEQGKPLSVAELNKLRIGNGLGQHPTVTYGVADAKKGSKADNAHRGSTKAKASKHKAKR